MVGLGHLFKKLGAMSGLGPLDRIAGFVFGSGKFFFIAAVIAYALNNIAAVRDNIREPLKNSIRITSYNVCYTKLLRFQRIMQHRQEHHERNHHEYRKVDAIHQSFTP